MPTTLRLAAPAPPPPRLRALGRALLHLAAATGMALLAAALVVLLVARAEFLTGASVGVIRVALGSGVVAVLAAASPLLMTLLIGYAHMQRAVRRRATARAAAAAAGAGGAVELDRGDVRPP